MKSKIIKKKKKNIDYLFNIRIRKKMYTLVCVISLTLHRCVPQRKNQSAKSEILEYNE